eukprot:TRINITY_DN3241_c0_g1_i1.p1 TRINITY_DN3241_c0_g1~~TRINITY_DN3241_c0_g1_i1.p1  ORF type:complete len:469 (-),score=81.40 TRINITY_DN3241_c0_g1_i1:13-1419(-)
MIQKPEFERFPWSKIEIIETEGERLKVRCNGSIVSVKRFSRPESSWTGEEKTSYADLFARIYQLRHENIVSCLGFTEGESGLDGIITEYVPTDLHTHLSKKTDWKFYEKMQFCMDICKGIAWLDLKGFQVPLVIENVRLGTTDVCKIDVSPLVLPALFPPLVTAYESLERPLLLSLEKDTTRNIYSFVLLFWEIFYHPRSLRNKLLGTPVMDPVVVRFLNKIFDGRLAFTASPTSKNTIVDGLNNAVLEIYFNVCVCGDTHLPPPIHYLSFSYGSWVWQNYFHGKTKVTFDDLFLAFTKHFSPNLLQEMKGSLKQYLTNGDSTVTVEAFRNFLIWFGDVTTDGASFVEMRDCVASSWFKGKIGREEAEKFLSSVQLPACFLVRLNLGGTSPITESPYVISYKTNNLVYHFRVVLTGDATSKGKYIIKDEAQVRWEFPKVPLTLLIANIRTVKGLGYPLPSSERSRYTT